MMNKKQLIELAVRSALAIVAAVSVSGFVVWYSLRQMALIGTSISEQQRLSYILEKRSETYRSLKTDFAVLGNANEKIRSALIPSDDISSYISALETLGAQTESGQSYHFGVPRASTETGQFVLTDIDYSLTIKANSYGLIAYMKKFEQMPYLAGIHSISMSSGSARGLDDLSNISMTAKLYVQHK